MWVSEEERNAYLERVRAEELFEKSGAIRAQQFRDVRRAVKLLNNMIVTDSSSNLRHEGILFHDVDDNRLPSDMYELQYKGEEALYFINEVREDYTAIIERRKFTVDNTGIMIMFDYLKRNVLITDDKYDQVKISLDRVMLFRNDVAAFGATEHQEVY
jgi:hypothetical protein